MATSHLKNISSRDEKIFTNLFLKVGPFIELAPHPRPCWSFRSHCPTPRALEEEASLVQQRHP